MKKIFGLITAFVLGVSLMGCGYVPPGNEGIIVNTLGDSQGVVPVPVETGYHYLGGFANLYNYPTFTQTYTWTAENKERITFGVQGGLQVGADVGITYHIDPGSAPKLFVKYRQGINEITNTYLHNMVRDAFNEIAPAHPIEYLTDGNGKAELVSAVQSAVQSQVGQYGIQIEKIYWVSQPELPAAIQASISSKLAAVQLAQQKQNELIQSQAEAAKTVATAEGNAKAAIAEANGEAQSILLKATAQSQANIALAKSVSPELTRYLEVKQWDGKLPLYSGQGTTMLLNPNGRN